MCAFVDVLLKITHWNYACCRSHLTIHTTLKQGGSIDSCAPCLVLVSIATSFTELPFTGAYVALTLQARASAMLFLLALLI